MTLDRPRSFPAIVDEGATTLVLGTLPGKVSLETGEYYANPRNQFWRIVADVFGGSPKDSYSDRCMRLFRNGVALWDVLHDARRDSSLDSDIKDEAPNAITEFLTRHSGVNRVLFNGKKASLLYRRHIEPTPDFLRERIRLHDLPSTSAAHTSPYARKLADWRSKLLGV